MEASVKLGRIWGIPIGLHTSWFLVFGLLTWTLSTGYFPLEYPHLSPWLHVILGVVTSVLFFGSVLGHELGHAAIALRNRIPVKSITLFIFGGVAQISREPRTPGAEFRIAIAGPLVSFALALFFGGVWLVSRSLPILAAPGVYLMRINFILAVFNLIPGFPLDGGRVLRAIVWALTKSFRQASQAAAFSGQLIAFGFIGFGIFTIFRGQLLNGAWLVFIGWFLQNAAASTYSQTNLQHAMEGITVGEVMNCDCERVTPLTPPGAGAFRWAALFLCYRGRSSLGHAHPEGHCPDTGAEMGFHHYWPGDGASPTLTHGCSGHGIDQGDANHGPGRYRPTTGFGPGRICGDSLTGAGRATFTQPGRIEDIIIGGMVADVGGWQCGHV